MLDENKVEEIKSKAQKELLEELGVTEADFQNIDLADRLLMEEAAKRMTENSNSENVSLEETLKMFGVTKKDLDNVGIDLDAITEKIIGQNLEALQEIDE